MTIFLEESLLDIDPNIQNRIQELIKIYKSPLEDIDINYENEDIFYKEGIDRSIYGYYSPSDKIVKMINKDKFPDDGKFGTYEQLTIHECMHAILDSIDAECSLDFQEGIACYESGQIRIFDGRPFKPKNIYIKYGRLVENIIKTDGYDRLLRIIHGEEQEPLPREDGIYESMINDHIQKFITECRRYI